MELRCAYSPITPSGGTTTLNEKMKELDIHVYQRLSMS